MHAWAALGSGGKLAAIWGVGGVVALLVQAIHRLVPFALEPLEDGTMTPPQWACYVGFAAFNAYAEGYRGFQRSFSPRVVARAFHLARHPRPLSVALAPVYCMAMFHARRRRLIAAWLLLALIVLVVIGVRHLSQPWRGIIDAGVVIGLAWGTLSLAWIFWRAIATGEVPPDDSLP
jgi:hypothetical protein